MNETEKRRARMAAYTWVTAVQLGDLAFAFDAADALFGACDFDHQIALDIIREEMLRRNLIKGDSE